MDNIRDQIKKDIETHHIILFMKGTKLMPVCGFSARVIAILNELGISYETRNVLDDENLRQEIKDFSNWPTIPQLYIGGKFIGGCDIISELHNQGDLKNLCEKR
jgi:monothiol glutaredoxin